MSNNRSNPRTSSPSAPSQATEPAPIAIDLQWVPAYVSKLVRELTVVRDLRMRSLALGERLSSLNTDDIIAVAKHLFARVNAGDDNARELLHCFQDAGALEMRLGAERMRKLAVAAKVEGNEVASLLLQPMEEPRGAVKHRTHQDLRELTLGERKALARSHSRDALLKLLEDEHPEVQHMLLNNPKVTVREVIAVAAKRPNKHHVLRGIARHPRWRHNFEVHRALAKNPDTPIDVSGRLVATLGRLDLLEIAEDDRLPTEIRRLAATRLSALDEQAARSLNEPAL